MCYVCEYVRECVRVLRLELCTIHPSLACADYDDGDHEDNVPFRLIEPLENASGVVKDFFDINERVLGLITLAPLFHNFLSCYHTHSSYTLFECGSPCLTLKACVVDDCSRVEREKLDVHRGQ